MHLGKYTSEAIELAGRSLTEDFDEDGKSWVNSFEQKFSTRVGDEFGVSVNSGTSGLHSALLAVGVGPGDEVISPALTVVMDAYATLFCGATPIFADVLEDSWNLDPESVRQKITPKTKAVLTVSWLGLPSNLLELAQICKQEEIALIDDSAEYIPKHGVFPPGWSEVDLRVFSFESKKHMPTGGEGGMITTSDSTLAERSRKFAGLGYKHLSASQGRTSLAASVSQRPDYQRFDKVGFNYRMTPTTAAVGIGQLNGLEEKLALRVKCANLIRDSLQNFESLAFQGGDLEPFNAYYAFGFSLPSGTGLAQWVKIYNYFQSITGFGFYANQSLPYREPSLSEFSESYSCPVAESIQPRIIAMKTNLRDEKEMKLQARAIADAIRFVGID